MLKRHYQRRLAWLFLSQMCGRAKSYDNFKNSVDDEYLFETQAFEIQCAAGPSTDFFSNKLFLGSKRENL